MSSKLDSLNHTDEDHAVEELLHCCHSARWANRMAKLRPFATVNEILESSDKIWFSLHHTDWLEAFKGHPKIGALKKLKNKPQTDQEWAEQEQSAVKGAGDKTLKVLKKLNDKYEKKFGFIFIVCATGKTTEEMILLLKDRLKNSLEDELLNAAREQSKITKLRLEKLL